MRKIAVFICVISILFISNITYAETTKVTKSITKLGRGVCNILTSPFEIVKEVSDTTDNNGPIAGLTVGFFKGLFGTGKRLAVGIYETVTFPFPGDNDYKAILTDPEYFLGQGWL